MCRISLPLFLAILFSALFVFTPLVAAELYFPHIASDGNWETEVGIINDGVTTLNGTLHGYNDSGVLIQSKSVSLDAGGRLELTVGNAFQNFTQITNMKLDTGEASCSGYEKFYQIGNYRVAIPAVSSVNSGNLYVPHIAADSTWWTGLALLNTNSTASTLTLTFSDGSQENLTLAGGQHWAGTIQGSFPNVNAPAVESAVLSNASGVIGLELFGSSAASDNHYLSGVLLSSQTEASLYYPHVASDGRWWTGIVSYNPNDSAATLTVTPYDTQGTPLANFPVNIAARGKYIGTAASLNLPSETAWFKVDSTLPVTGFELFGTHDGKQLAGYSAVHLNTTNGTFVKLDKEGWTGIAFVNIESSAATVTLTARDDTGATIATEAFNLPANGKQVALAEDFFTGNISSASFITFSSDGEVVGFQLNGSSDEMLLDALPGLPKGGDGNGDAGPSTASAPITPDGGSISVYNSRGDRITLVLPAGALAETVEITVTALDTPPAAPFSMSLFPGVSLEPHGLILDEPATLRVSFAEPQANPETSLLVWTVDADTAIPLGNQTSTATEISGEIYNFSDKTGGQPSAEETEEMVLTAEDKFRLVGFLDDKYGWADTRLMVEAFMFWYRQADELGDLETADGFYNKALEALELGALSFLAFDVPANPCSEYVPILNKYLKYAKALFLNDHDLENLLAGKLLAANDDWCCFSLSGTWSAKEVADETGCDEGINTYTSTAAVSQVGGLVSMTGMGGYFTATKSKCFLFGWGGESEDGGTSFGNGSGSISADGNKITLSGSWTWSGVVDGEPESCSGTSRLTLRR